MTLPSSSHPSPFSSPPSSRRSSPDNDNDEHELDTPNTPSFAHPFSPFALDRDQQGSRTSVGQEREAQNKDNVRGELILEQDNGDSDGEDYWGQPDHVRDNHWAEDADETESGAFLHPHSSSSSHPSSPSASSQPSTLSSLTLLQLRSSLTSTSLSLPYALSLLASSSSSRASRLILPPLFLLLIAGISCSTHVVIVYLARYLGVKRVEDLVRGVPGCRGKKSKNSARLVVGLAGIGLMIVHLGVMADAVYPLAAAYLPLNSFIQSRILWNLLASLLAFPFILPLPLITRSTPYISLLLPIPILIIILTHSIRISKGTEFLPSSFPSASSTSFGSILGSTDNGSSFWAAITLLTLILSTCSPHLTTLPNHASLPKQSQPSFPLVPLAATLIHLTFLMPMALTPFYLLDASALLPMMPPNILDIIPETETSSIIIGKLSAFFLTACSLSTIFDPTRDIFVRFFSAMPTIQIPLSSTHSFTLSWPFIAPSRQSRPRKSSAPSTSLLSQTVLLYIPLLFLPLLPPQQILRSILLPLTTSLLVLLTYLLPSLFFVLLFHLRRPLSIIFPPSTSASTSASPPSWEPPPPTPSMPPSTPRFTSTASTFSAGLQANDNLLALKESELQRRRTGKRLWQDGVVFLGTLPVGVAVCFWSFGRGVGLW